MSTPDNETTPVSVEELTTTLEAVLPVLRYGLLHLGIAATRQHMVIDVSDKDKVTDDMRENARVADAMMVRAGNLYDEAVRVVTLVRGGEPPAQVLPLAEMLGVKPR